MSKYRDRPSNYEKFPVCAVGDDELCREGWQTIAAVIAQSDPRVVVVEAYPGVRPDDLRELASRLAATVVIDAGEAMRSEAEIDALIADDLTDDPVFGRLTDFGLEAFFDSERIRDLQQRLQGGSGRAVVYGPGAALVARGDVVVYADLPRWEIQQRQRREEVANLGASNFEERASLKYKRAYFVDWRAADRWKRAVWDRVDFFLDTTRRDTPRLVSAATMNRALDRVCRRPFRVVPFFDPAPWGGQWMKEVCDLPRDADNFGWCFDCVPEENSMLLGFGRRTFEIPAIDLVYRHPAELLGDAIVERFGAEFPIRFDFLDTIGGGNLSVQVHPLTEYIQARFGMSYTQDESYYMLDADPGAFVHLGVKTGIDPAKMIEALRRSEDGIESFPVADYVNRFPAQRHDHFLIPAGTVHGSGSGSMVLEISATPYIFTFKLYDWERPGLDGRPRPLHIAHGERNIRFERDTEFARDELINRNKPLGAGDGWRSERTGLHEAEFIETQRHWFTGTVPHEARGAVDVLNLVQGEAAVVESPGGAFAPFEVHYAETFIVPAAAGEYRIRPLGDGEHATIKAFVRT